MQKLALCALVTVSFVFLGGCKHSTVEGTGGKKLTLVKPANQTIKRGDTNQVTVGVTRSNFSDDVTISFDNLPQGVSVVDKEKKIAGSDNTATYTLKADANAALVTNHEVKVTASGPDGMKVTESFTLTVQDNAANKGSAPNNNNK